MEIYDGDWNNMTITYTEYQPEMIHSFPTIFCIFSTCPWHRFVLLIHFFLGCDLP